MNSLKSIKNINKSYYIMKREPEKIHHLGANPRGNDLRRVHIGHEQHIKSRVMPVGKKILPHQVLKNTPFNKDPLATAHIRMNFPTSNTEVSRPHTERYLDNQLNVSRGGDNNPVLPLYKNEALRNPMIHKVQRGSDARSKMLEARRQSSMKADHNELNRTRAYN